jgi:hypothetical protein
MIPGSIPLASVAVGARKCKEGRHHEELSFVIICTTTASVLFGRVSASITLLHFLLEEDIKKSEKAKTVS